ncbi:MAG: hypothetical protein OJF59_001584 [Cytophagales bacterium]|jgi:hypothetical protein|nr:hypothetical protein [Bacteroidota bacterium]MBS1980515.1 hypothetical protein [Bacteroidota bacterium]WHZ07831.1 MAG: hypothetical protein OJF59_001584 [Cytophagales bacterium]
MEALVDFIKILLPASVVLYAVYLVVRAFIHREIELRKLEVRSRSIETILPARLQAYERITLFLERISPQNLLTRLNNPAFTAREFQKVLLDEIRNEYNYNSSQQVFMSEAVWNQVRFAKEELILQINEAARQLDSQSTSNDLSKKIFEMLMEQDVNTIDLALRDLKKEIQQTF